MKFRTFGVLTLLCVALLSAQTNLAGNIGGMTLEQSGNPFLVGDNLIISAGKTLTVKDGCVFLFKPFTGIIVEGSLVVEGTLDKPVRFTCVNDTRYNPESTELPNPFDWNGILITPKAEKVKLSNFVLEYSVYGVKSQKEELIINNGTFKQNGQFHVTVKDVIKPVADNVPFSLGSTSDEPKKDKKMKNTGSPNWIKPIAIGTGITGVIGLGVGAFFLSQKASFADKYLSAQTQPERDDYITKQESALVNATITGIIGGVLLVTGVTLYIWNKQSNKNVALYPIIGTENGIIVGINF